MYVITSDYDGYIVDVYVVPLNGALDDGIQKITVTVTYHTIGLRTNKWKDSSCWRTTRDTP